MNTHFWIEYFLRKRQFDLEAIVVVDLLRLYNSRTMSLLLEVLMNFRRDSIHKVQDVINHGFFLCWQSSVHVIDLDACISIDLLRNTFAWSNMLKSYIKISAIWICFKKFSLLLLRSLWIASRVLRGTFRFLRWLHPLPASIFLPCLKTIFYLRYRQPLSIVINNFVCRKTFTQF